MELFRHSRLLKKIKNTKLLKYENSIGTIHVLGPYLEIISHAQDQSLGNIWIK